MTEKVLGRLPHMLDCHMVGYILFLMKTDYIGDIGAYN